MRRHLPPGCSRRNGTHGSPCRLAVSWLDERPGDYVHTPGLPLVRRRPRGGRGRLRGAGKRIPTGGHRPGPQLRQLYGEQVPVVTVDGATVGFWRIDADVLREALA